MLSDTAWNRIRTYTDQVCNRELDYIIFEEGVVHRDKGNDVHIHLDALTTNLEPQGQED